MPDLIRHPEPVEFTGFRLPPEWQKRKISDFLRVHQFCFFTLLIMYGPPFLVHLSRMKTRRVSFHFQGWNHRGVQNRKEITSGYSVSCRTPLLPFWAFRFVTRSVMTTSRFFTKQRYLILAFKSNNLMKRSETEGGGRMNARPKSEGTKWKA